jgi:hypothetical protein
MSVWKIITGGWGYDSRSWSYSPWYSECLFVDYFYPVRHYLIASYMVSIKRKAHNINNQIMFIISDKEINSLPHEEFASFEYHIHRLWQLHGEFKPQFVLLRYTNLVNQLDAFLAIYNA